MKSFYRLIAFVTAIVGTTEAHAAPSLPDARVPSWEQSHLKEGDHTTRVIYMLAVCVRNRRLAAAEAMLKTTPGSRKEYSAMPLARPPVYDECLRGATKLRIGNLDLLRGALAEAIYNGFKVRPHSGQAIGTDLMAIVPRQANQGSSRAVTRSVATCTVRASPAGAHDVLQFNPGSVGELRALRKLTSTLASCLPADARLDPNRLAIRAALSEALYHAWRARPDLFHMVGRR